MLEPRDDRSLSRKPAPIEPALRRCAGLVEFPVEQIQVELEAAVVGCGVGEG